MLDASDPEGLSVALPALYDTTAGTGLPPEVGARVKVAVVMVPAFIASLNVTTTFEATATPVAPLVGDTLVTVGDVTSGAVPAVVKLLVSSGETPLPAASFAPEVTLTT